MDAESSRQDSSAEGDCQRKIRFKIGSVAPENDSNSNGDLETDAPVVQSGQSTMPALSSQDDIFPESQGSGTLISSGSVNYEDFSPTQGGKSSPEKSGVTSRSTPRKRKHDKIFSSPDSKLPKIVEEACSDSNTYDSNQPSQFGSQCRLRLDSQDVEEVENVSRRSCEIIHTSKDISAGNSILVDLGDETDEEDGVTPLPSSQATLDVAFAGDINTRLAIKVNGNSSDSERGRKSPNEVTLIKDKTKDTAIELINVESDSHLTPETKTQLNNGVTPAPVVRQQVTGTFVLSWYCDMSSLTKQVTSRELLQCTYVENDENGQSLLPIDISPGALADVSDHSKNNSPTSNAALPYQLPGLTAKTRQSFISTTSSSSLSSSGSLQINNISALKASQKILTRPHIYQNGSTSFEIPVEYLAHAEESQSKAALNSLFVSPKNVSVKRSSAKKPTSAPEQFVTVLSSAPIPTPDVIPEAVPDLDISKIKDTEAVGPTSEPKKKAKARGSRKKTATGTKPESTSPSDIAEETEEAPKQKCITPTDTPKSSTKKFAGSRSRQRAVKADVCSPIVEAEAENTVRNKRKGPARGLVMVDEAKKCPEETVKSHDSVNTKGSAFARWNDKKYYSGTIVGKTKDSRVNIKFDDGNSKCLMEEFVIPVNTLHKGFSVYAKVNNADYESGIIINFEVIDLVVHYVVTMDTGRTVTVPRSALSLTEDQAKFLREDLELTASECQGSSSNGTPKRLADVSQDNILHSKRSRNGHRDANQPGVSGEPRHHSDVFRTDSDTSGPRSNSVDDISGIDQDYFPDAYPSLSSYGLSKKPSKVKGCVNAATGKSKGKSNEEALVDQLGPIPSSPKLFAGYKFLLTCSGRDLQQYKTKQYADNGSSTENNDGAMSDCPYYVTPYVKDRLIQQLTAGGGVVCHDFDELSKHRLENCVLISDAPCNTKNYILCLAYNIRIVNHEWVIFSCKKSKILSLNSFTVPAGYSIAKEIYVEEKDRHMKRALLKNMEVILASEVDSFVAFWSKVLETLGARVTVMATLDLDDKPSANDVDIIVSDHTLTRPMMNWAMEYGISVVSSEWIKQCIINAEKSDVKYKAYQLDAFDP